LHEIGAPANAVGLYLLVRLSQYSRVEAMEWAEDKDTAGNIIVDQIQDAAHEVFGPR
jgi:hypothetical protein